MRFVQRFPWLICIAFAYVAASRLFAADLPPASPSAVDIPKLIGKLVDVTDEDVGYSPSISGTAFAPLDREGNVSTMMLFQKPTARSETIRLLVKEGVRAVPHLIAHLDDKRPTTMRIEGGFFIGFGEHLDRNPRTDEPPPNATAKPPEQSDRYHVVSVGDLCFVALGQIVNRRYDAVRYIPSGIIDVNSPVRSENMRIWIKHYWGDLTPAKHRASLVRDFLHPDDRQRRIDACKRLAYYYPGELESQALKFLALPTYDSSKIYHLVQKQLYHAKTPEEAKALFDAFIAQNGEPARDGILMQLFDDLGYREAAEQNNLHPHETGFTDQPRRLLIQLYGKSKGVKAAEKPILDTLADYQKSGVIKEGLVYDRNPAIDRTVREMLSTTDDDVIAVACMDRLIGRGFDNEIEAALKRWKARLSKEDFSNHFSACVKKFGWTWLHVVVARGDIDSVREAARDPKLVNAEARNGKTPLHLAAEGGDLEIVEELLKAGAQIDPTDKDGWTPAQLAIRQEQYDVVQFLGRKGCSAPDILVAIATGKPDSVSEIIKKQPASIGETTKWQNQTLLHLAVIFRQPAVAERLIAGGANVEAKNFFDRTSLYLAAEKGAVAVARVLIQGRAKVRLDSGKPEDEPLYAAVCEDQAEMTELLLSSGAPIYLKSQGGNLLHLAIRSGCVEVLGVLLKHGVPVDARTDDGYTALQLAAINGHAEAIKRLIAAKALLDAICQDGFTALHIAVQRGRKAAVEALLNAGASVDLRNSDGLTPLHVAVNSDELEIAKLLLARKASANALTKFGSSPLHCAVTLVEPVDAKMVQLLLENGANPSLKNSDGLTATDLARQAKLKDIADFLDKHSKKP